MAAEDFTSANWNNGTPQQDEDSDISVIAGKASWVEMSRNDTAYFYRDMDAGHFSGDFEHLLEVELTAVSGNGLLSYWTVANDIGDRKALIVADKDLILCDHYQDDLRMWEVNAGGETIGDKSYTLTTGTERWLKIKRVEGGTSYVYCYIYDSTARDNLVDTITLELTEDQNFRYVYSIMGFDDNFSSGAWGSGYTKELDLQEAAAGRVTKNTRAFPLGEAHSMPLRF